MTNSKDNIDVGNIFANFIGVAISALVKEGYTPQQVKHIITASLANEISKYSMDDSGKIDQYAAKPLYRATVYCLENEKKFMQEDAYMEPVRDQIAITDMIIKYLNNKIALLKEDN